MKTYTLAQFMASQHRLAEGPLVPSWAINVRPWGPCTDVQLSFGFPDPKLTWEA